MLNANGLGKNTRTNVMDFEILNREFLNSQFQISQLCPACLSLHDIQSK